MIKEYLAYLRERRWVAVLIYLGLILGLVLTREEAIPGNPDSGSNFLTFALPIIILTALLIYICYKTGEKPRWQWGLPKKEDEDK